MMQLAFHIPVALKCRLRCGRGATYCWQQSFVAMHIWFVTTQRVLAVHHPKGAAHWYSRTHKQCAFKAHESPIYRWKLCKYLNVLKKTNVSSTIRFECERTICAYKQGGGGPEQWHGVVVWTANIIYDGKQTNEATCVWAHTHVSTQHKYECR